MIQFPLPQPMTVDEFLHKHHPVHGIQPWLNYCEICIDKQGYIYECIPSHQELAISYMCQTEHCNREQLLKVLPTYISPIHYVAERYELLFLWNNYGIGYDHYDTPIMLSILQKLKDAGLFQRNQIPTIRLSREYSIVQLRGDDKPIH